MNFFETWHAPAGSAFAERPWWHVSDDASLERVGHLIPHTVRAPGGARRKDEL